MSSTPMNLSNISNISDTISGTTPEIFPPRRGAKDEGRIFDRAWVKVQESKCRLRHLKNLRKEGLGTNMDEFFLRKSSSQRRSKMSHGKSKRQVIKITMDSCIDAS